MRYLVQEPDMDTLCRTTADMIVSAAKKAIKKRGYFTFVLSGGNTPRQLYELLAGEAYRERIDWKKTYIFWSDERYLPQTDTANNSNMARRTLLDHVPIPEENIFAVPVDLTPKKAAKRYEKTIARFFLVGKLKFDITLLGLGENGHTASLFPGSKLLKEKKKFVAATFVEDVHMYRITFTLPLLLATRKILFLVSGAPKAAVLDKVIFGDYQPKLLPAQLVHHKKNDIYFCFDDAAGTAVAESLAELT